MEPHTCDGKRQNSVRRSVQPQRRRQRSARWRTSASSTPSARTGAPAGPSGGPVAIRVGRRVLAGPRSATHRKAAAQIAERNLVIGILFGLQSSGIQTTEYAEPGANTLRM